MRRARRPRARPARAGGGRGAQARCRSPRRRQRTPFHRYPARKRRLAPLTVSFDGRGSSDPEGAALAYAWDLDADGAYDDSTSATPSRTYTQNGQVTVGLRVTDPSGARQIWRLEMDNLHELDEIGISRTTFQPGDRVTVSGDPDRTKPREIYLRRLDRPSDGLRYEQIGSRPRLTLTRGPG